MELGDRMKKYERCYDVKLTSRIPVIIRLDGRAFHSWTKKVKCKKPFDDRMIILMSDTTKYLCENISGCIFGYTQSDEISLLLVSDQNNDTEAWFDNKLQKIVSISASMATYCFNQDSPFDKKYPAFFDSRAFVIPQLEVKNYFVWRQRDAIKNSISAFAESFFSNKELKGKNSIQRKEMCLERGADWNALWNPIKMGFAIYKKEDETNGETKRKRFFKDDSISHFQSGDSENIFNEIFKYQE